MKNCSLRLLLIVIGFFLTSQAVANEATLVLLWEDKPSLIDQTEWNREGYDSGEGHLSSMVIRFDGREIYWVMPDPNSNQYSASDHETAFRTPGVPRKYTVQPGRHSIQVHVAGKWRGWSGGWELMNNGLINVPWKKREYIIEKTIDIGEGQIYALELKKEKLIALSYERMTFLEVRDAEIRRARAASPQPARPSATVQAEDDPPQKKQQGKILGPEIIRINARGDEDPNGEYYAALVSFNDATPPYYIEIDWGDGQTSKDTRHARPGPNPRRRVWVQTKHKYNITRQTRVTVSVKAWGKGTPTNSPMTASRTAIISP